MVNGQPIAVSEVEERVAPELARLATGPAGEAQRKDLLHRGLEQLIDERLVESEASSLGLDIPEEELQHLIESLAKQNGMDVAQFREAIAQQGISYETVRDTLRRQQLMVRLLQYRVKPRKVSDEEVQAAYANLAAEGDVEVRARHIYIAAADGLTPARLKDATRPMVFEASRNEMDAVGEQRGRERVAGVSLVMRAVVRERQRTGALDRAAFSLQPGQVSDLIRTSGEHGGWHLLLIEDRRKLPPKPLVEVQEEIRNRLANDSILKEREHYLASLRKSAQIDEKL